MRIWMTGAGLVTAVGATTDATWVRLAKGERGIGPVTLFDAKGHRAELAAEVPGVTLPEREGEHGAWSRTSALGLRAAEEAIAEAKLDVRAMRVGLVCGGTTGGMFETEALLARLHAEPKAHEAIESMLAHPLTATGDRLVERLGPFARVRSVCSACSSGANAFIVAALWLLAGEVDAVVAGGADGLCRLTFSGFNALGAMDPEPCRPFDRRRRGLTLGEGAGFAVFERASRAEARGARPIAELAGWALAAEAHHITNPEPTGRTASRVIEQAMARARLGAATLDYVNAHGTATPLNDPMESAALARALGNEVKRIPVSSSKGQLGHTLGAAGAIEGILAAHAVKRQAILPTAGLEDPDPACALVHVMRVGREARVRAAASNSFGFGGMDTVLVFSEPGSGPGLDSGPRRVVITGAATLTARGLLGAEGSVDLLEASPSKASVVQAGPLAIDLSAHLDATRARRLDRPARLGAVVTALALDQASAPRGERQPHTRPLDRARVGAVHGSAFGSVDASAAYMHRLFDKGPRFASPAEFPNLVPSSPVGHVSIYLGLFGPALATADLATSGESAVLQAVELVAGGESDAVVALAIEEASVIVERVLVALFARSRAEMDRPRSEGAAALIVESEESALLREAKVLARVAHVHAWRDGAVKPLAALVAPRDAKTARVVLPRENGGVDALLDASAWRDVPRSTCSARAGENEGLGAVAAAAGAGLIASGRASEVLVVGLAKGRGYAITLAAP